MQRLFQDNYVRRATGVPASNAVLRAIQDDGVRQAQEDPRRYYTNRTPAVFQRPSPEFQEATATVTESILVPIDSAERDTYLFPDSNAFFINFGQVLHNVRQIELVSTEVPASAPVVDATNNHLFVQTSEDRLGGGGVYNCPYVSSGTTIIYTLPSHGITAQKDVFVSAVIGASPLIFMGTRTVFPIDANTFLMNYATTAGSGTVMVDLGIPVYDIAIPEGIYTTDSLPAAVQTVGNQLQRLSNGKFFFFDVSLDNDSSLFDVQSLDTTLLVNNPLSTTLGSGTVIVSQYNHAFQTGGSVTLTNCTSVAGILAATLNTNHTVTSTTSNTFSFLTSTQANSTTTGGGNTALSGVGLPIQVRAGYTTNETTPYANNLGPLVGWEPEDSGVPLNPNPLTPITYPVSNVAITAPGIMTVTLTPQPYITVTSIASINATYTASVQNGLNQVPTSVTLTLPGPIVYTVFATPTSPAAFTFPFSPPTLAFSFTGAVYYHLLPVTVLSYTYDGSVHVTTSGPHNLAQQGVLQYTLTDASQITISTFLTDVNQLQYSGPDPGALFVGATIAISQVATFLRNPNTQIVLNASNNLVQNTLGTFTFTDTTTFLTDVTPLSAAQLGVVYASTTGTKDFAGSVFTLNPNVLVAAGELVVTVATKTGSTFLVTVTPAFTITASTIGRFTLVNGTIIEVEVIPYTTTKLNFTGSSLPASAFVGATFRHSGSLVRLSTFEHFPYTPLDFFVHSVIDATHFTVNTDITTIFSIPEYVYTGIVVVNHPLHQFNLVTVTTQHNQFHDFLSFTTAIPHGYNGTQAIQTAICYFISPTVVQLRVPVPFYLVLKDRIYIVDDRSRTLFGTPTIDSVLPPQAGFGQIYYFWNVVVPVGSTLPADVFNFTPSSPLATTPSPNNAINVSIYRGDQVLIQNILFAGAYPISTRTIDTAFILGVNDHLDTNFPPGSFNVTVTGTMDRKNEVALSRVRGDDLSLYSLCGIPLEVLQNRYHPLRLLNENYYALQMYGLFTDRPAPGQMGGTDVRVSSERHGFAEHRCNTIDWTPTGQIYKSADLSGENAIYLQSPNLDTMVPASTTIGAVFAKLRLQSGPGFVNFDDFLSSPKFFEISLNAMSGMFLQIVTRRGALYNFNKHDWQCTFKITYERKLIVDAALNTRNGDANKK